MVKKRVLIIAFGNPDNVLSFANNLSDKVNTDVVFAVSGKRFRQGILDIDLSFLNSGYHKNIGLGECIDNFIKGKFRINFLKTDNNKFPFKKGWFKNLKIYKDFAYIINRENYDVIHFNGTSGFLLYLLFFIRHKNKFWTLHDYKSHLGEKNIIGDLLNKIYVNLFDLKFIQHYEYLRKKFINYYNVNDSRVTTIYSGSFDIYDAYPEIKPVETLPENYLLFYGRLSEYKGINFLVEAFKDIKENINLIIAGEGKIKIETGSSRITFINRYMNPEELKYLIKHSDFLLLPYLESTHSGVIMTAYAMNKPVLVSDVGGIKEVVNEKTGMLFEKNNKQDFISKIKNMYNKNPDEYTTNILKYRREGNINWKNIISRITSLYFG